MNIDSYFNLRKILLKSAALISKLIPNFNPAFSPEIAFWRWLLDGLPSGINT